MSDREDPLAERIEYAGPSGVNPRPPILLGMGILTLISSAVSILVGVLMMWGVLSVLRSAFIFSTAYTPVLTGSGQLPADRARELASMIADQHSLTGAQSHVLAMALAHAGTHLIADHEQILNKAAVANHVFRFRNGMSPTADVLGTWNSRMWLSDSKLDYEIVTESAVLAATVLPTGEVTSVRSRPIFRFSILADADADYRLKLILLGIDSAIRVIAGFMLLVASIQAIRSSTTVLRSYRQWLWLKVPLSFFSAAAMFLVMLSILNQRFASNVDDQPALTAFLAAGSWLALGLVVPAIVVLVVRLREITTWAGTEPMA